MANQAARWDLKAWRIVGLFLFAAGFGCLLASSASAATEPYVRRISSSAKAQYYAYANLFTSGNWIVWTDSRNDKCNYALDPHCQSNTDIYAYDQKAKREIRVTSRTTPEVARAMDGDWLVYMETIGLYADPTPPKFYLRNLLTGEERQFVQTTGGSIEPGPFAVSDGKVVWTALDGNGPARQVQVMLYDIATKQTRQAFSKSAQIPNIDLSGTSLLWESYPVNVPPENATQGELHIFDLTRNTDSLITTVTGSFFFTTPKLSEKRIVWADFRSGQYRILSYDLATNRLQTLSTQDGRSDEPAISGDTAVWHFIPTCYSSAYCGSFIHAYDFSTNTERLVDINWANHTYVQQSAPDVSDKKIVWLDMRDGRPGYDVYLYDPSYSANLVPTAIAFTPKAVRPGGKVTITDTIKNQGVVAASATQVSYSLWTDYPYVFVGKWFDVKRKVPALAPGASSTVSTVVTIPEYMNDDPRQGRFTGPYQVCLSIDAPPEGSIGYDNPCAKERLLVTLPNLVISQVYAMGTVLPGGAIKVTDTVKNQEAVAAGASTVGYVLSLDQIAGSNDIAITATRLVAALAAGASSANTTGISVIVPTGTPTGSYYVCAIPDVNNQVEELGESYYTPKDYLCSNSPSVLVARPDLTIQVSSLTPRTISVGTVVSTTVSVRNMALITTPAATVGYKLSKDGTYSADDIALTGTWTINPAMIGLGGSVAQVMTYGPVVPASTPGGTYYICAKVDYADTVIEGNESNNTACSATAYVTIPKPDLTVTVTLISTTGIGRGTPLSVWDTVKNIGPAGTAVPTNFKVAYYLTKQKDVVGPGDILLQTARTIASLAVGASSSAKTDSVVTTTTPVGTYWVCARVDEKLTIDEGNEANNVSCYPTPLNVN